MQSVERIVQCSTRDVRPPPRFRQQGVYHWGDADRRQDCADSRYRKVLHELAPVIVEELDEQLLSERSVHCSRAVACWSWMTPVALHQTMITLRKLELDCQMVRSAADALELLQKQFDAGAHRGVGLRYRNARNGRLRLGSYPA